MDEDELDPNLAKEIERQIGMHPDELMILSQEDPELHNTETVLALKLYTKLMRDMRAAEFLIETIIDNADRLGIGALMCALSTSPNTPFEDGIQRIVKHILDIKVISKEIEEDDNE